MTASMRTTSPRTIPDHLMEADFVTDDCRGGGFPITVDIETAVDRYPELAFSIES